MFFELLLLRQLIQTLTARRQALRADPEVGYTTETVVVTALLVALALAAVGVIVAKVMSSANHITTSGGG